MLGPGLVAHLVEKLWRLRGGHVVLLDAWSFACRVCHFPAVGRRSAFRTRREGAAVPGMPNKGKDKALSGAVFRKSSCVA
jgi:hypothetical protein